MHRLLRRQLRQLGIDPDAASLDAASLGGLLELVSRSYEEDDERIALIQRSLKISSREMRTMYKELERISEQWIEAVLKAIPDLMFLIDANGSFINVFDEGKTEMMHLPKEEVIGKNLYDLFPKQQADAFFALIRQSLETSQLQSLHYDLDVAEGKRYFEARAVTTQAREKGLQTVIVIVRDISEVRKMEQNSRLLSTVFSEATEGVMIENEQREVIFINPAMQKILGISEASCLGRRPEDFEGLVPDEIYGQIQASMSLSGHWHGETKLHTVDGRDLLVWLSIDALQDKDGNTTNIVVMMTDISEIHLSRERLQYMATHDVLTELPNRVLLFDRLEHALAAIQRRGGMAALLYMDLDHFKDINDTYGHQAGDQLLRDVARRIEEHVRKSDTFGRLSGDEFMLITEKIEHLDEVIAVLQKIRDVFAQPFQVRSNEIAVTLSIGIALIPDDGMHAEKLVSAADRAMYVVKNRGGDGFEFYSEDYSILSHEYFKIQYMTRRALRENDFDMVYQPQFSIKDGRMVGAEALLRCRDPEVGDIPMSRLIAIAEESGTIYELGRLALRSVCRQVAQWRKLSLMPIRIAINLSRREIGYRSLVETVQKNLDEFEVTPDEIEFEITESTLMLSSGVAKENIDALRRMGFAFSIDDFGTGYSSLSNLKEFDLDKLKIDKSFIDMLETDINDQIIVQATITMAKKLGLTVLAEGVENERQVRMLEAYGCEEVQGFFFGRPVPADEMTDLLRAVNG